MLIGYSKGRGDLVDRVALGGRVAVASAAIIDQHFALRLILRRPLRLRHQFLQRPLQ